MSCGKNASFITVQSLEVHLRKYSVDSNENEEIERKEFGRKQSFPKRDILPVFDWRNRQNQEKLIRIFHIQVEIRNDPLPVQISYLPLPTSPVHISFRCLYPNLYGQCPWMITKSDSSPNRILVSLKLDVWSAISPLFLNTSYSEEVQALHIFWP